VKRWLVGLALVGLVAGVSRRARAGAPLAAGDLERNWGTTPAWLRPLLLRVEAAARIPGAARFLAVVSWRESKWHPDAHNDSATEVSYSTDAYTARSPKLPALAYGFAAADFGSGGLFGLLAPYFLWTGTPELGAKAPLLDRPPAAMFDPATSAFAAAVYLQRIVANYEPADWADVRAGWASPSLLTTGRGGEKYDEVRARFLADAAAVGIDLEDRATMPAVPSANDWPGVLDVYDAIVAVNS